MSTERILLAGATGYLGRHIAQKLLEREHPTNLIVRNKKTCLFDPEAFTISEAQVTNRETLTEVFKGIDVVISTVGITRQKDGLTYNDVDYQANVNLIDEAKKKGVKKFIYISVFNGQLLRHLKICEAKEKLVDYLKESGLDYCIIRPNGFFSDMGEFLEMAKSGRVFLFGKKDFKLNPIHGADLADVCVRSITSDEKEIDVGGPDVFTQREVAELAFKALSKKVVIVSLPDWIRTSLLWLVRTLTPQKVYGPLEFFLTVMAMDNVSPQYGNHTLEDYFKEKVNSPNK